MKLLDKVFRFSGRLLGMSILTLACIAFVFFLIVLTIIGFYYFDFNQQPKRGYCSIDALPIDNWSYGIEKYQLGSEIINGIYVSDSEIVQLVECETGKIILKNIISYYKSKENNLYLISKNEERISYLDFSLSDNRYLLYDSLSSIPSNTKQIFMNNNLFSSIDEVMNKKEKEEFFYKED